MAAATMKPMNARAMTILIFQSASAAMTMPPATSVVIAARRAVLPMSRDLAFSVEACNLDARRTGRDGLPRRTPPRDRPPAAALARGGARRGRGGRPRARLGRLAAG